MIARTTDETLPVVFADVIADSVKKGSETIKKVEALLVTDEEEGRLQGPSSSYARQVPGRPRTWWARPKASGNAAETGARLQGDVPRPPRKAYESGVLDLLAMERKAIDDMSQAIDARQRAQPATAACC